MFVGVIDGVTVFVGVIDGVTVFVGVIVGVFVFVGVTELVGVIVGVTEFVGVIVGVTEFVGVGLRLIIAPQLTFCDVYISLQVTQFVKSLDTLKPKIVVVITEIAISVVPEGGNMYMYGR